MKLSHRLWSRRRLLSTAAATSAATFLRPSRDGLDGTATFAVDPEAELGPEGFGGPPPRRQ